MKKGVRNLFRKVDGGTRSTASVVIPAKAGTHIDPIGGIRNP